MVGATGLLFISASVCVQDADLSERICKIVDERYADAPVEHRALVTRRMAAVLGGRPDVGREKIESFVNQLDQTFQYVRSFVHPYDLRAQGSTAWPPLPEAMKARQLDLELRWAETYFRDGLEARPLTAENRETISRQVDGLINQVRNIIASRVVGTYADEAIDGKLRNMRHNLLGTFDFPVSKDLPRLMSSAEVEGILEQVRKVAGGLKDNVEINESLGKLRDDAFMDRSTDPEARARREQLIQRHNQISGVIEGLSKPLYDVFDLWGPERAKIRGELEQLRKEVLAWRQEASDEMNRKAREKNAALTPAPSAGVSRPAEAPPSATLPTKVSPPPKARPAEIPPSTSSSRPPWELLAAIFLASAVAGYAIRRSTSKSAGRS